jgi:spore maturation protein CgeB
MYPAWEAAVDEARRELASADAAIVTSYCPDGAAACDLTLSECRGARVFYDMDTPVTLGRLEAGETVAYLPKDGLGDFDLVLSLTGGRALEALRTKLGARRTAPLYGTVDPAVHHPTRADDRFRADLSYLGIFAADRRVALEDLLVEPARRLPARRFVVAGSLYPNDFLLQPNIWLLPHVDPGQHAAFFSSAWLSLNVTRGTMARWGWCPSGRLFEAAACAAPQITDAWEGLEAFFEPGEEILVARSAGDVVDAIALSRGELVRMALAARERVLAQHAADVRARELVAMLLHGDAAPTHAEPHQPATLEGA